MAAGTITVDRVGGTVVVLVDGVEIPAEAIRRHSLTVPVDPDEAPTIHLELIARRVEVTNTLNSEEAPRGTAVR